MKRRLSGESAAQEPTAEDYEMAQSLTSSSNTPSNPSPIKNKNASEIEKPMRQISTNPGFKTSSFLPSDWNSGLPEDEVSMNEDVDGEDVDGEDLDGVDVDGEEVDVDGDEVFVPPPSAVQEVEVGRKKRPTAVDVEDEGQAMEIGSDDDIF